MKEEWRYISKHKFLILVIIMVALIPAIYSNVFLGSVWRPYQSIENLPVAVVNKDEGARIEDKIINVGNDLVKELNEKKSLKFDFINDEDKAIEELNKGKYYMVLKIDENFSKNASKILNKAPLKMELEYTINPGLNFISTKITDSAMKDIQKELIRTIQGTYIKLLFDNIDKLRDGFTNVAEGTKQINEGAEKLNAGQNELNKGINSFVDGSRQLNTGVNNLNSGIKEYTDGVNKLSNGLNQLSSNSSKITSGFEQFSNKVGEGQKSISNGFNELISNLEKIGSSLPKNEDIEKLNKALQDIKKGAEDLNVGSKEYLSYMKLLNSGIEKLNDAHNQTNESISNAQKQMMEFLDYVVSLFPEDQQEDVMAKLIDRLTKTDLMILSNKFNELKEGSEKLLNLSNSVLGNEENVTGTYKLVNGIQRLKDGIDAYSEQQSRLNNAMAMLASGFNNDNSLISGIKKLESGVNSYTAGVTSGISELSSGIGSYISGVNDASNGASELNGNSYNLLNGSNRLASSIGILNYNSNKLLNGSNDLLVGSRTLSNATDKMYNEIKKSVDQAVDYSFDEDNAKVFGDPLSINRHETSVVVNNGHALAPYMMTISLFIGAMGICMVFPFNRKRYSNSNILVWWLNKLSVLIVEAFLQSIILVLSLKLFLKLQPLYLTDLFIITFFSSFAFLSIVSFFVVNFGSIGKFLSVIVLVLQLATSEGTYPLDLSNPAFKVISKILPATYSIRGMKEAISINGSIGRYILVLILFILVFNAFTLMVLWIGRRKNWQIYKLNDENKIMY